MIKLRVVLAGLLGGVVLFVWLGIAHMALPLGMVGVSELPPNSPLPQQMKANIPSAGLYFFPGMDVPVDASRAERQAAMPAYQKKYAEGPTGLLIYHPEGGEMMSASQLGGELASNLLQGLALAMILALLASHTVWNGAYVGFAAGVCASIATNVSYWDWYGFPANYTASQIVTQLIGYVLMGIACGWLMGRLAKKAAA